MAEKTEAQKRAQAEYMKRFVIARARMTQEKHSTMQTHAAARGESVSAFINRAITETMEKDKAKDAE